MKTAAVIPASREVRLIEREEPSIRQADQVKLRMLDVGICGTDREICTFAYGTPPAGFDYLVIGHEALGEVLEVGSEVSHLSPGDLVVPTVRRPCSHAGCRSCRAGHQDYCETGDFTERGISKAHGYLTEFVVDEARYMHPVPHHMRQIAVLVEPLTIAEKAMHQLYGLMQRRPPWIDPAVSERAQGCGRRALVLGAGPTGLLGAMALRAAEFDTFIYSREQAPDPRVDIANAIGATYVSSQALPAHQLGGQIGPIDLVYEAVGHSRLALEVLRALGPNGIYVLTGVPNLQAVMDADPAAILRDMVLKNQVVLGTVNAGPDAFRAAIADLETFDQRWPGAVRHLIADRAPIADAVHHVLDRPAGIKSVITLHSESATAAG
jgi:threonine dehydrogenase-like Zn-dependent dehydrogenase